MSDQGDLLEPVTPAEEFGDPHRIPELRHELLLVNRIRQFPGSSLVGLFGGDLTELDRAQLVRRAILDRGIAEAVSAPNSKRKCLTFAEAFQWVYGEPLVPTPRKGKT